MGVEENKPGPLPAPRPTFDFGLEEATEAGLPLSLSWL